MTGQVGLCHHVLPPLSYRVTKTNSIPQGPYWQDKELDEMMASYSIRLLEFIQARRRRQIFIVRCSTMLVHLFITELYTDHSGDGFTKFHMHACLMSVTHCVL